MMPEKVNRYYVFFEKIRNSAMYFSGAIVFIMMIYTCADVVLRNVQGYSTLYAYEMSQNYFMPLLVFPGLAFAFSSGIMPKIDFILDKFSIKTQKTINIALFVIEIVLITLLLVYGLQYMLHAIDIGQSFTAGGSSFPLWPVILFVPIGLLLVLIEVVFQLIITIYK